MKQCNKCGTQIEDQSNFCTACGNAEFTESSPNGAEPTVQPTGNFECQNIGNDPEPIVETKLTAGNALLGILGAFLFAIGGGIVYFLIYQVGFIAGISGLVTFILANLGYGIFSRHKNASVIGLISSIAATLVMLFLAEYFCLSFDIFRIYKEEGFAITVMDAIRLTPEFLAEDEVAVAVFKDLTIAYIFGFAATAGNIVSLVKSKKNSQAGQ